MLAYRNKDNVLCSLDGCGLVFHSNWHAIEFMYDMKRGEDHLVPISLIILNSPVLLISLQPRKCFHLFQDIIRFVHVKEDFLSRVQLRY